MDEPNNLTINGNISVNSPNIALGFQAGNTLQGSQNVAVGYQSGFYQTGANNTFIGPGAGYNGGALQTGASNTFIGSSTIATVGAGNNNTTLGAGATVSTSYGNSTAIGTGATITASNQIVLGTASETVSIPGPLSTAAITASSVITANGGLTMGGSNNITLGNGSVAPTSAQIGYTVTSTNRFVSIGISNSNWIYVFSGSVYSSVAITAGVWFLTLQGSYQSDGVYACNVQGSGIGLSTVNVGVPNIVSDYKYNIGTLLTTSYGNEPFIQRYAISYIFTTTTSQTIYGTVRVLHSSTNQSLTPSVLVTATRIA